MPLLGFALAVVTGLALLQVAIALRAPESSVAAGEERTRATARRFYAAVEVAFASGDFGPLRSIVDPRYAGHDATLASVQTLDDFEDDIAKTRRAQPSLRLEVVAITTDRDRAVVALSSVDAGSLADGAESTSIEVIRVAGGLVVERWQLGSSREQPAAATLVGSREGSTFDAWAPPRTPGGRATTPPILTPTDGLICRASSCS